MGKILRISLKLNFSPNTLGCYGLNKVGLVFNAGFILISMSATCFAFLKARLKYLKGLALSNNQVKYDKSPE